MFEPGLCRIPDAKPQIKPGGIPRAYLFSRFGYEVVLL
jgi:hypothetical protein